MNFNYEVKKIALHLVDRALSEPRFSSEEINLSAFKSDDRVALEEFFSGHLEEIWLATESDDNRMRAAKFSGSSKVKEYYDLIKNDPTKFFELSKKMAVLLNDVSKGKNTSAGLLLILWFQKTGDDRHFLALFKMDPGHIDKIILNQDESKTVLLGLAVKHIDQALPDPGTRVLKWAVVPHPTLSDFDARVKDNVGDPDPAQYFMDFIGCEVKASEKKQVKYLIKNLLEYADEYIEDEKERESAVNEVLDELTKIDEEEVIVHNVVATKIEGKSLGGFQTRMEEDPKLANINVKPIVLRNVTVQYHLAGGITIRLPKGVENLVAIETRNENDIVFHISTTSYKKSYV